MKYVIIALVASNGVIGDGTSQPLSFPEDWARFKRVTMGHPLIVGRKTHEAMGLLPGRTSIVVTSDPQSVQATFADDAPHRAVGSLDQAMDLAASLDDEVAFIAGGGQIYLQGMDVADELDLTLAHVPAQGTVTFPQIDHNIWLEVERVAHDQFDFVRFVRR